MKYGDSKYLNNSINEKIGRVINKEIIELTDFLDPSEINSAEEVLKKYRNEIGFSFYGGPEYSERKRLLIFPCGCNILSKDFEISVIQATAPKLQKEIGHRDVLGAIIGLGIKREKLGDIFIIPEGAAVIAETSIARFIADNFPIIKNNSFYTEIMDADIYAFPEISLTEKVINVASFRLDGLLAKAYNLSRTSSQEYISSGKVKVNHRIVEKTDYQLNPGDLVSVRTKGRFMIKEELGRTKKDNLRIKLDIY